MKKNLKPLVIVTGPHKRWRFGWWAARFMLWMAGLRSRYLTPVTKEMPVGAKGILIGGGDDIEPEHYGLKGDGSAHYDPERDRLEMHMVRQALISGVPILGICRGAQLINIVMGGSLFTDIRSRRRLTPNRNSLFPIKWADIDEGSILNQLTNKKKLKINSLHNQAVDHVSPDLCVSARDRDHFIQAIEARDKERFILGVQWHPEYLPYVLSQRKIFSGFADAVRKSAGILNCTIPEISP